MAVYALTAMYVNISSNDLTDHIKSATLALEGTALDSTAMGDSWVENTMGLKSGTLTIEILDDAAASNVDSIIWGAFNTGTSVTFEVRPTNAAVGAGNPKYTGSILPTQYNLGGTLNEMATKSLTFPTTGAVSRATS